MCRTSPPATSGEPGSRPGIIPVPQAQHAPPLGRPDAASARARSRWPPRVARENGPAPKSETCDRGRRRSTASPIPACDFNDLVQHNAPFAVDLQRFARPVQRRRERVPFLRIGRKAPHEIFDLRQQGVSSGVQRRTVEGGITIKTVEAIARQNRPERRRDRDPPFRIETRGVVRNEPIHMDTQLPRAPDRSGTQAIGGSAASGPSRRIAGPRAPATTHLGIYGLTWDYMGRQLGAASGLSARRITSINGS